MASKAGVRYGGEPFSQCSMSLALLSSSAVVMMVVCRVVRAPVASDESEANAYDEKTDCLSIIHIIYLHIFAATVEADGNALALYQSAHACQP